MIWFGIEANSHSLLIFHFKDFGLLADGFNDQLVRFTGVLDQVSYLTGLVFNQTAESCIPLLLFEFVIQLVVHKVFDELNSLLL